MIGDRTFVMVKGPSHFGANFGLTTDHLRFLASSQTLSLSLNGEKECHVWVAMTWQASSCAAKASSQAADRVFKWDSTVGIVVLEIIDGRAQGSYPIMR